MQAAADPSAASGMQALKQHASPVLLELLQKHGSSSSADAELSAAAVDLLQQVAGSSAAAAWQVLQWLQPLVLAQVQQGDLVSRYGQA
jgi:hypothetical protein